MSHRDRRAAFNARKEHDRETPADPPRYYFPPDEPPKPSFFMRLFGLMITDPGVSVRNDVNYLANAERMKSYGLWFGK